MFGNLTSREITQMPGDSDVEHPPQVLVALHLLAPQGGGSSLLWLM
jgi:hypothetical protein